MPKIGLLLSVTTIAIIVLILWFRIGATNATDTLTPVGFFGPFKRKNKTVAKSAAKTVAKTVAPATKPQQLDVKIAKMNKATGKRNCRGCLCKFEEEALANVTGKDVMGAPLSQIFGAVSSSCVCSTCT